MIVILVLMEDIYQEQLLTHAQLAIQLVQPALEDFILNARSVTLLLLLWLMEMSAEEYVVQDSSGNHQIILVSPVWLPVLTALELELITVTAALMDFI